MTLAPAIGDSDGGSGTLVVQPIEVATGTEVHTS